MLINNQYIKKYMMAQNNSPKNAPYNVFGFFDQSLPCLTNPRKTVDCKVMILLNVRNGVIKDARAEVFGEPAVVAAASLIIGSIKGLLYPLNMESFSSFWRAYPRKDDKGHARKAWKAALKKAPETAIIAGLRRYQFNDDRKYQPLAATWLNGERWGDQPPELPIHPTTGRQFTPLTGGF